MKRSHRKVHRILWLVLLPLLLILVYVAMNARVPVPANESLPGATLGEELP